MRITVKVGTSTLAHATGRLNIQRMEGLCKVLSDLKNAGHEIILVSSGAIGMGVGKLQLAQPKNHGFQLYVSIAEGGFHGIVRLCGDDLRICPRSRRPPPWASAS